MASIKGYFDECKHKCRHRHWSIAISVVEGVGNHDPLLLPVSTAIPSKYSERQGDKSAAIAQQKKSHDSSIANTPNAILTSDDLLPSLPFRLACLFYNGLLKP